ncbi:MAG: Nif3-like dinuclear metal center hexameric protein [Syntrophomonadaceae bacterium]|nr:Nif3-like dinuclear metal center hexameric protein [Syntrophomonadaceae bacterium]
MLARVKDMVEIIEGHFPLRLAEKWDNAGLQVGSLQYPVRRVLVALDMDQEVLRYAREHEADMVITHHPLLFNGLKSINYDQAAGSLIKGIVEAGITVYAAHTNLDAGERGLNQILAERIGLGNIKPLDQGRTEALYKLVVYVPSDHEKTVRCAMMEAGAGHIGKYSDCSFRVKGTGSFRPLTGSTPFIGQEGILQEVEEYRLETLLPQARLDQVLSSMLRAHPYEEAAYDIFRLERTGQVFSLGRIGQLTEAVSLKELGEQVKTRLGLRNLRIAGDMSQSIKKVAVVSGAGAGFIKTARNRGCDALVTGDLKYHEAREALDLGLAVIDAGHQGTEQIMSSYICSLLQDAARQMELQVEAISFLNQDCMVVI